MSQSLEARRLPEVLRPRPDTTAPRSRRSLLAAAGAGAAGLAAASLGRPVRTLANNGDAVVAGTTTTATSPTTVAIESGAFIVLAGINNDETVDSVSAIYGEAHGTHSNGVEGYSAHPTSVVAGVVGTANGSGGIGVKGIGGDMGMSAMATRVGGTGLLGHATAASGIGVSGYAGTLDPGLAFGVKGEIAGSGGIAVVGQAPAGSTGVLGFTGEFPTCPPEVGVMGSSAESAFSVGVYGETMDGTGVYGYAQGTGQGVVGQGDLGAGVHGTSSSGIGVFGESSSMAGVRGSSHTGPGLSGESTSGTGVKALSGSGAALRAEAGTGRAIEAVGRVAFASAGRGTIAKGTRSKTITSPVALTAGSKVLVTLMGNPGGTIVVQRVAISSTAKTITVYLTGVAAAATPFSFFVID